MSESKVLRDNRANIIFVKKGECASLNEVLCSDGRNTATHLMSHSHDWSSTENNSNNAYKLNFSNGNSNNNNKNNTNNVRAILAFSQYDLFHQPIPLSEFFEAYFDCRKKKRSTCSAIKFEVDYEQEIIKLANEVNSGSYKPDTSLAFIIDKPVKREVFAASFRDRIVHHLLINKINHLFERAFINDSYSCRVGKGTHYAIKRLDHFIRSCSENYTKDCYILKLDIEGFFMHIDRRLLYSKLRAFLLENYDGLDVDVVLDLVHKIVFYEPTIKCRVKGSICNWNGLPKNKSLFYAPLSCGLPIGNLTSQVFANFYMNDFDHFMKHTLGLRYYGRYVDDFVIVHNDKEFLKKLVPQIREFLSVNLHLRLHPRKVYLQHFNKGVRYLGVIIKPYRKYIVNRTYGNMYDRISILNDIVEQRPPTRADRRLFVSSINSYLGIMRHYSTFKKCSALMNRYLSIWWKRRAEISNCCVTVALKH